MPVSTYLFLLFHRLFNVFILLIVQVLFIGDFGENVFVNRPLRKELVIDFWPEL